MSESNDMTPREFGGFVGDLIRGDERETIEELLDAIDEVREDLEGKQGNEESVEHGHNINNIHRYANLWVGGNGGRRMD